MDGYIIFITGDPVTLGCWEPDMAVQLNPSVKSSNKWTAVIKVTLPTEITLCQTSQVRWYILGQFPKLAMISSKQVNNEQIIFNKACCGWSGQGKLENKLDRRKLSDFSILEEILLSK